jgi:endonuclease VIII
MPEGDVVLRTARRLDLALRGRVLTVCDLRWPSLATADLTGRSVLEVVSRGKHLLLRADGGLTLHSHLRMEGSWWVQASTVRLPGGARGGQIRAVLGNQRWTAVGYRLGMLDLVPTAAEPTLVGHLGPDLLGPDWDRATALANLASGLDRPVGEALMDQRLLAGIGTFFMAESCFLRGISPWTPVREVDDLPALVDLAQRLIVANAGRAGQSTTGDLREGAQQWVHARSGRPCRRCGGTVRVASIGIPPRDRAAFWCPGCQPGPTPTDDGRRQFPLGASRRAAQRPLPPASG